MGQNKNNQTEQLLRIAESLRQGQQSPQAREDTLRSFAQQNLNEQQAAALQKLLDDPNALQQALASEAARKLMEKFSK